MDFSNVIYTEIYGGIILIVMIIIIVMLFINDIIRRQMVYACKKALENREKIARISVDKRTADYLRRNNDHELYRVDEFISKKDNIIRYRLCLRKRSFDFYLRKKNLWNYIVVAIQMY